MTVIQQRPLFCINRWCPNGDQADDQSTLHVVRGEKFIIVCCENCKRIYLVDERRDVGELSRP